MLAATVAGLARYILASVEPILREVPIRAGDAYFAGRQDAFVGTQTGPASRRRNGGSGRHQILDVPFSRHFCITSVEAGMTTSLVYSGMCLPFRIFAAIAISSTRPPVQEPMYPWFSFTGP